MALLVANVALDAPPLADVPLPLTAAVAQQLSDRPQLVVPEHFDGALGACLMLDLLDRLLLPNQELLLMSIWRLSGLLVRVFLLRVLLLCQRRMLLVLLMAVLSR